MNLKGKTVLLTGASGGIGRALALVLAQEGARLLLTGRSTEKLDNLLSELDLLSSEEHESFQSDLSDTSQRAALVNKAQAMKVNVLINMACVNDLSLIEDTTDQQVDQLISMNLVVPINLTREILAYFTEQKEAIIINVGSIMGSIGYPGSSLYCASKFGFRGFSEALRRELAGSSVKVIYLAPRATATSMNSERMVNMNKALGVHVDTPDIVARQLVKALKQANSQSYYLGWPEKLFVKINALFPWLVDNSVFKQLPIIKYYAKLNTSLEKLS
jgi:short-subunit dehydrogenase